MTEIVKKLYNAALKDQEFITAYKEADNDKVPNIFSSEQAMVLFATIYYGWIIHKYGKTWEQYI